MRPEEPDAAPWRAQPLAVVAATLMRRGHGERADHRPVVLALDGRSSSGKTTLAARLQDVVAGSAVVHTDDIAWQHSRFGWDDLLIGGILAPARTGRLASYHPPRWDERQRAGAIEVPADCPLLIIEGVGAARRESAHLTDATIWVQADERETERRNLARVGRRGGSPTVQHMRDLTRTRVGAHYASWAKLVHRPAGMVDRIEGVAQVFGTGLGGGGRHR